MDESWLDFLDRNCYAIIIVLCIAAIIFIMIGHEYRDQIQTKLKQEFIKLPATSIDWWSVSHFILYMIIGFLIPEKPVTFLLIGTAFEVIEDGLAADSCTQFINCMEEKNKKESFMCKFSINNDYYYMNWSDIFVNLFGYIAGSSIRTTFFR